MAYTYELSWHTALEAAGSLPMLEVLIKGLSPTQLANDLINPAAQAEHEVNSASRYFTSNVEFVQMPFQHSTDIINRPSILWGYSGCALLTFDEQRVSLRFPLLSKSALEIARTFALLLSTLERQTAFLPYRQRGRVATLTQETRIMPVIGEEHHFSVFGEISHELRGLLIGYYCNSARRSHEEMPVPQPVVDAMQETWRAIAAPELQEFATNCGGTIGPMATFRLWCFGEGCELGIYPVDAAHDDWTRPVTVHDKRVDSPTQLLTLVCGFVRLCMFLRRGY